MSPDDKDVFYHCFPRHEAADFSDITVNYPPSKAGTVTFVGAEQRLNNTWVHLNTLPGLEPASRPVDATHVLVPIQGGLARYVTGLADVPMSRCVPTRYYVAWGHRTVSSVGHAGRTVTVTMTTTFVEGDS